MGLREVCGNDYALAFEVHAQGAVFYCCALCALAEGAVGVRDRV